MFSTNKESSMSPEFNKALRPARSAFLPIAFVLIFCSAVVYVGIHILSIPTYAEKEVVAETHFFSNEVTDPYAQVGRYLDDLQTTAYATEDAELLTEEIEAALSDNKLTNAEFKSIDDHYSRYLSMKSKAKLQAKLQSNN